MAKYEYIALDARGQESRGVIEAPNPNDAVGQLRQSGYFPTSVVEEGKGVPATRNKKAQKAMKAATAPKAKGGITLFTKKTVSGKTLMIFTRQLATLIDAGLPLLRGLTVLAKQEKDVVLKNTINSLADAVQGGSSS
jgi:type IV pilus assembly protein PilC